MSTSTTQLRHVWRDVSTGDGIVRVLGLQQWQEADGWEHPDIVAQGGYWEDIEVVTVEDKLFPL